MKLLDSLQKATSYRLKADSGGAVPHLPGTIAGRIRADGRFLVNDAGTFRPLFVSAFGCLTQLREGREADCAAYLDWAVRTGFNGLRVFAGALTWQNQSAEQARAHLPRLLEMAMARGLHVEVTAITDSAVGYDTEAHVDTVTQICAEAGNTLVEIANEPYHGSQASDVHDFNYLRELGDTFCASRGLTWACGAWETDEPDPVIAAIEGDYLTLHLNRSRDEWNQVRRVRELEAASSNFNRFVMNNEPIGWNEVSIPGKRNANPKIAFTMGVLSRLFEVGLVSHADHALHSTLPGPVQQACHDAAVRGFRSIPTEDRLSFKNARRPDAPDAGGFDFHANFATDGNPGTILRLFTGVSGDRAWQVPLGLTGDPQIIRNGWRVVDTIADEGSVRVLEIERI